MWCDDWNRCSRNGVIMARFRLMGFVPKKSINPASRGILKFSKTKRKKGYMMFGNVEMFPWLKER